MNFKTWVMGWRVFGQITQDKKKAIEREWIKHVHSFSISFAYFISIETKQRKWKQRTDTTWSLPGFPENPSCSDRRKPFQSCCIYLLVLFLHWRKQIIINKSKYIERYPLILSFQTWNTQNSLKNEKNKWKKSMSLFLYELSFGLSFLLLLLGFRCGFN